MNERDHVAAVRREGLALAAAAEAGYRQPVTIYPHWTVADMVAHTGSVHRWVVGLITQRARGGLERQPHHERDPQRLGDWFRSGLRELVAILGDTDPRELVWTMAEEQTVGFWCRRMAHETTVHRWDVQGAVRVAEPIDRELALTGIPETLEIHLSRPTSGAAIGGRGQRLRLRCSDAGDEWIVTILDDRLTVSPGPADTDGALVGTASELWLSIMSRRASVTYHGDPETERLFRRALSLVPPPRF
jgi:uncharacterized protein (TIGR03083 family)